MARVVIAASASIDQAAILTDLMTKAGPVTAGKFRNLFSALFDRLARHPHIGPLRPALGPTIRIGIVPPYIVLYDHTPNDDVVTVLRIVHGRRRISGAMLAEP